ncbi:MAG: CotH kinase family protein [Bacteroidota bacterium]
MAGRSQRLFISCIFSLIFFQGVYAQTVNHWETAIGTNTVWQYIVPDVNTSQNWKNVGFNTNSWRSGNASVGYGDNDDATEVPSGTLSVYMVIRFGVADTTAIAKAIFHMDADDGFVAYLNGTEIARSNIDTALHPPLWNTLASDHEAALYQNAQPERFEISYERLMAVLKRGNNTLAVEIHNAEPTSSDLTAFPFLSFGMRSSGLTFQPTPAWFSEPSDFASSSNLPIIHIRTTQDIPDEPKITADMGIIYNGPGLRNYRDSSWNHFTGKIGIEIRGASSQSFPKKSFSVETRDDTGANRDVSLLGMPAENDWVLYAPYTDKTFMRDALAYSWGRDMGRYASRTAFCELFINNIYQGIYCLEEKVKRSSKRVNISKLKPEDIAGDNLTGGYLLELDRPAGPETYFESRYTPPNSNGYLPKVSYIDPDGTELLPVQKNYITNFFRRMEDTLKRAPFSPTGGYHRYMDVDSYIDFFLINEISNNVDGYRLSTYFYKNKNSKDSLMHMGPFWDFNLGFGNADYCDASATNNWAWDIGSRCRGSDNLPAFWWSRLNQDPDWHKRVECRYQHLRTTIWSNAKVTARIDSFQTLLTEAAQRNFVKWPIIGQYVWPNAFVGGTWAQDMNYLKIWIGDRLNWLDFNIPLRCTLTGVEGPEIKEQRFSVYPNPASGNIVNLTLPYSGTVKLWNILGKQVIEQAVVPGDGTLDIQGLSPGLYRVELSAKGRREFMNLVIE